MKHKTLYIGIDPGKNGGICSIDADSNPVTFDKMPDNPHELAEVLIGIKECAESVTCYLEKVSASPQMGTVSAFTFGQGFGRLESALACLQIPYDIVTPQRWQKELGCMTGGDKNVSKARALAMFPTVKVTHAIADALLIAEYCRRTRLCW